MGNTHHMHHGQDPRKPGPLGERGLPGASAIVQGTDGGDCESMMQDCVSCAKCSADCADQAALMSQEDAERANWLAADYKTAAV
ncbi:unnamed protein product [Notodromas monacha]|uniref:Uncharacterized protein n=1 Tax=Notodromas monacha TaxID=399045 RepID=A0A7R9GJH4_9CRUS|nr:unnamed protein product [Notodromas monacha]CAG0923665.1 unnamed protein product [Notodromas monacha]